MKLSRRKKAVKALLAAVLVICVFDLAITNFNLSSFSYQVITRRILSVYQDKTPIAHKWKDDRRLVDVPRLVHFMLLGDSLPEPLIEIVKFSSKSAEKNGFNTRVWKDEDADKLVESHEYKFPGLKQSWEYVKADETTQKGAKRADFLRTLVMWAVGGVHIDADYVVCDSLEFLVDAPGVISFPAMPAPTHEVNGCAMSAPPHHRLFEIALETFIDQGASITTAHNLEAAGPHIMANITDQYFKEIGVELDPIYVGDKSMPFEAEPVEGVIEIIEDSAEGFWKATVADIRFRGDTTHYDLYHLATRSWQGEKNKMKATCLEHPELISPFLEKFCSNKQLNTWKVPFETECGIDFKKDDITSPSAIQ